MRFLLALVATCTVLLAMSPAMAAAVGAVRVTGGVAKLRAADDVRSDVGWLGSIELQPRGGWPFLGVAFGGLPISNASKPLDMIRFGAAFVLPIPGAKAGPLRAQLLVSGGGQWTRLPVQDELPVGLSAAVIIPNSEGWSPYGGVGLGVGGQVGGSTQLSLEAGAAATHLDGSTQVYPTAGLALTITVPEL